MIAAAEMVAMAAALVEAGVLCGLEAMAKLLASKSSWFAADVCLQIQRPHGLGGRVRHRMQIRRDAALRDWGRSPRTSSYGISDTAGEYLIMAGGGYNVVRGGLRR
jgi:hypothetical protein